MHYSREGIPPLGYTSKGGLIMKVLQINAVYGIGSTGRTTKELDLALKQNGIDSMVATTVGAQEKSAYLIGTPLDWKLHALLSRLTGKQGYFSRHSTKRLLRLIQKEKVGVVHLRNLHSNYIHLPLLLKYLAKEDIPTVITLHDCWFFTGKCTHYVAEGCYKWQNGCYKCSKLRADNKSWIFDKTSVMWNDKKNLFSAIPRLAVVGVSDWVTNEAKKSFLKDAKIVKRIYNWIDIDVFKPTESQELRTQLKIGDRFTVLGVAQYWSDAKGLSKFISLANKLPDVLFLMIGSMPANIDLADNIISVGTINDAAELAQYYSMADVFLNPSLYETFGKTTAESIACGTPVIGYATTATPELIGKNCGELLEVDSTVSEIEKAILLIKKRNKNYYSQYCRDFAVRNFSQNILVKEYESLYEKIIEMKDRVL